MLRKNQCSRNEGREDATPSRSQRLRAFYERILRGDPGRRKIALVATAHHMLRTMLAMLQTGELWRSEQQEACS